MEHARKLCVSAWLCVCGGWLLVTALGQVARAELDLSEASSLILLRENRVSVDADGLKTMLVRRRVKVLTDDAIGFIGDVEIPYNAHYQKARFVGGCTITPRGESVAVQTNLVVDMLPQSQGMYREYSDNRRIAFSMPALSKGAVMEYEVEIRDVLSVMSNAVWDVFDFDSFYPAEKTRYALSAPVGRTLHVRTSDGLAPPVVTTNDARVEYVWEEDNLDPIVYEFGMPPTPDVVRSVMVTSLDSWDAVTSWYQGLLQDRCEVNDAMVAKAGELTAGCADDMEKIVVLTDFVQRSVRYVAIELGQGAYRPRPATECFANLYGDCKDQAVLLAGLLRVVGIDSDLVLNRPRYSGTLVKSMPMPAQFNHVILHVPSRGLWLDPTIAYLGAFTHPESLDGVESLVVSDVADRCGFKTIPSPPAEQSWSESRYRVDISHDGLHRVTISYVNHGRQAQAQREYISGMADEERRKTVEDHAKSIPGYRRLVRWDVLGMDGTTNTSMLVIEMDAEAVLTPTALGFACEMDLGDVAGDVTLYEPDDSRKGRRQAWVRNGFSRVSEFYSILLPPGYRMTRKDAAADWTLVNGAAHFSGVQTNAGRIESSIRIDAVPCRIEARQYDSERRKLARLLSRARRTIEVVDEVAELRSNLKPDRARDLIDTLISRHPDDGFLYARKGDLLSACGYLFAARGAYEEALRRIPTRASLYERPADTYSGHVGMLGEGYDRTKIVEILSRGIGKVDVPVDLDLAMIRAHTISARGRSMDSGMDMSKALELAAKGTKDYPEDGRTWLWYGDTLFFDRQYRAAHEAFSRAVEICPYAVGGYIGQWRSAAMDGDVEAFLQSMKTVYSDEDAQFQEMCYVAIRLAVDRQFEEAVYVAEAAADLKGGDPQARAVVDEVASVTARTLRDYATFLDLSTPESASLTAIAAVMFEDPARFRKVLSKAVTPSDATLRMQCSNPAGALLSSDVLNVGMASLMAEGNVTVVEIAPGLKRVNIRRRQLGAAGAASSQFNTLCRKEGDDWRLVDFASGYMGSGFLGLAFEQALKDGDAGLSGHLMKYVERMAQESRGARFIAAKEFLAQPFTDSTNQWKAVAACYLRGLGSIDARRRSVRYLEDLSKAEPDNRALWPMMAESYLGFAEFKKAAYAADRASQLNSGDPKHLLLRVWALLMAGEIEGAGEAFARLKELSPSNPALQSLNTQLALRAGRFSDAYELARREWGGRKFFGSVDQRIMLLSGHLDELTAVENELEKDGYDRDVHMNLCATYDTLDRPDDVRRHCEIVLLNDRSDQAALYMLCQQMLLCGRRDEAECLLGQMKALDRDPDDHTAKYGPLLFGLGQYDAAAKAFLGRQMALDEEHYVYLFAGVCHLLKGDKTEAHAFLERAAGSENEDEHAGDYALMLLGRKNAADILAVLEKCKDYERKSDLLCEFNFYRGILALTQGAGPAAAKAFQASRDTKAQRNIEHFLARVMLRSCTKEPSGPPAGDVRL